MKALITTGAFEGVKGELVKLYKVGEHVSSAIIRLTFNEKPADMQFNADEFELVEY